MGTSLIEGILNPPILFFVLGVLASCSKSGLALPEQISKFLAFYLLISIGMHGGYELSSSALDTQVAMVLGVAAVLAVAIPIWSFFVLRLKLDSQNAAAIAATYGSISAVTFVTAIGVLQSMSIDFSGHMIAAMALMESPAIIVGVLLSRMCQSPPAKLEFGLVSQDSKPPMKLILKESIVSPPIVLLIGALTIGFLSGEHGWKSMEPVFKTPFKGVLVLFLLDMGIQSGKQLGELRKTGLFLVLFAILAAMFHAALAIVVARILQLGQGDALLLAVLCGSASYIAVPAAAKIALPESNPSLYLPMSLGITFPFNVVIGIPAYLSVIQCVWNS